MKSATSMLSIKAIPGAFHWMLVEMARWFQEMLGSTRSWYFTLTVFCLLCPDWGHLKSFLVRPWSIGCWTRLPPQPSTLPGGRSSLLSSAMKIHRRPLHSIICDILSRTWTCVCTKELPTCPRVWAPIKATVWFSSKPNSGTEKIRWSSDFRH